MHNFLNNTDYIKMDFNGFGNHKLNRHNILKLHFVRKIEMMNTKCLGFLRFVERVDSLAIDNVVGNEKNLDILISKGLINIVIANDKNITILKYITQNIKLFNKLKFFMTEKSKYCIESVYDHIINARALDLLYLGINIEVYNTSSRNMVRDLKRIQGVKICYMHD